MSRPAVASHATESPSNAAQWRRYVVIRFYSYCTQVMKLETEAKLKSLILKVSQNGTRTIESETKRRFGRVAWQRTDNEVGNWRPSTHFDPGKTGQSKGAWTPGTAAQTPGYQQESNVRSSCHPQVSGKPITARRQVNLRHGRLPVSSGMGFVRCRFYALANWSRMARAISRFAAAVGTSTLRRRSAKCSSSWMGASKTVSRASGETSPKFLQ